MTPLISDNLFLVILVFGGALVSVRAHELYLTPAPRKDAKWLVDEMHMRHLTGQRQFVTGFMFYLMPVLLVYVLLSVSPEILNLFMGIAGTTNSVGALNLAGSQVQTFAPMLAATAVITLFSVKPFSIFEQSMRRASHSIAGIPQHVQDIVRQIRQIDFRTTPDDSPLPAMKLDHVMAIPGLDNDLSAIWKLNEWIFGSVGMQVWSEKANQAMHLAQQRITGEYNSLKRKLAHTQPTADSSGSDEPALTDEALEEIIRQARELRIQFTRLLAVLIANQDEPLPERVASTPLWHLVSHAQRKRASSRHINVLAYSTLTGAAISILLATVYNFSIIVFNQLSIQRVVFDYAQNALLIAGMSITEFYWSSLVYAARGALWDVLGISLIFFAGCAAALIYRNARVNSAQWELWHSRSHPVFQYAGAALLACVSAILFYELFLLVKLVVLPSIEIRNSGHFASILRDFGSDYMLFGLLGLLVAPSAIMVCRVSDYFDIHNNYVSLWRDPWVYRLGCWVGLGSMVLYLFIRLWIGEIRDITAVAPELVVPGLTFFIMCTAYWRIGDARPIPARAGFSRKQEQEQEQDNARDRPEPVTARSQRTTADSIVEELHQ